MKKIISVFISLIIIFLTTGVVNADNEGQFVSIVNPVRISSYNKNPEKSLLSEYQVISGFNLPATWLLTYDILENPELLSILKNMNSKQEFGVFLEVSGNFAKKAKVEYNDSGFWHHSNSLFLTGYSQEERIILIDTVFNLFKEKFGYYPTSVGSWWTDSFSLSYMKENYGITANLGCSDQFSTDGYKIWGQPFSIPFYPSKYHSGIPASDESVKLDIVTTLWAPRDPLNGYYNSLFSTQDYLVSGKDLNTEYFRKLVETYAYKNSNSFGQITVGLEADLDPQMYKGEYFKQISYIKELNDNGQVDVVNMNVFSDWFKDSYKELNPSNYIYSKDLLGSENSAIWFQNYKYRFSYEEKENGEIEVRDFRVYDINFQEPFYISPNGSYDLNINTPSIIDKVSYLKNSWILDRGSTINFFDDHIIIETESDIPEFVKKSRYLIIQRKSNEIKISFKAFNYPKEGKVVRDFSIEAKHILKSPKALFRAILNRKFSLFKKIDYLIPQEEIIALEFLYAQPKGNVLVFNEECLQCSYSTSIKPLVFSNSRKYVQRLSGKKIVYNSDIFENLSREEAKKKLKDLNIKYIYLVRFELYKEKVPYSPGDLGIEKIFENANAEVWIVK
ncbi:hypothetical protein ACFL15_02120 [Patescibacteria group bacterium]